MIWLTEEQILALHTDIITATGGIDGIRDRGILDSAISVPFATVFGKDCFPSDLEKIVRFAYGLINNHPFLDGNKRIGTHVMLVLCRVNGIKINYTQKELSSIIWSLASGESLYETLLKWAKSRSQV